jgi:hypothetical protein
MATVQLTVVAVGGILGLTAVNGHTMISCRGAGLQGLMSAVRRGGASTGPRGDQMIDTTDKCPRDAGALLA